MTNEIAIREESRLPDLATVEQELKAIRNFQAKVKALLTPIHDFGTIPGTDKPTLLKPGAEKIVKICLCVPRYEIIEAREDYEKGFFAYTYKCIIRKLGTNTVVDEGIGHCNSLETKYRWRWVYENEIPKAYDKNDFPSKSSVSKKGNKYTLYRIPNDEPYTIVNTIMKMAKKRALVDAALSLGSLSDIFTQDLEVEEEAIETETPAKAETKTEEEWEHHDKQAKMSYETMAKDPKWANLNQLVISFTQLSDDDSPKKGFENLGIRQGFWGLAKGHLGYTEEMVHTIAQEIAPLHANPNGTLSMKNFTKPQLDDVMRLLYQYRVQEATE